MRMKKRILPLMFFAAMLGNVASAQDDKFFDIVDFKGAIGTNDWTQGWANFRPDTIKYPGEPGGASRTVVNLNAGDNSLVISSNTTWTKDKVYYMSNKVIVQSGAILTIEPGTVIRSSKVGTTRAGMLIVARGGKLIAKGTLEEPIVFTSSFPVGQRNIGDWGGVLLMGKAPHADNGDARLEAGSSNINPSSIYEAFDKSDPDASYLYFGGSDNNDNSGILEYVRIEFGGWYKVLGAEVNALTLAGVGKGTTLSHIQASFTNDDSYEWYGGSVDAKYLIAYGSNDDDFDTDLGATPRVQFALGIRHPLLFESGGGSRGIEADGNSDFDYAKNYSPGGENNAIDTKPLSTPVFSNITLIGPVYPGQTKSMLVSGHGFDNGVVIRTNSEFQLFNSVISGFPAGGVRIRHADATKTPSCFEKALDGRVQFKNNIITNCDVMVGSADKVPSNVTFPSGVAAGSFDTKKFIFQSEFKNDSTFKNAASVLNIDAYLDQNALDPDVTAGSIHNISVIPVSGSPSLLGADFSYAKLENDSKATGINRKYETTSVVSFFPNPLKGAVLKMNIDKPSDLVVEISSVQGVVFYSEAGHFDMASNEITLTSMPKGMYVVKVIEGEKMGSYKLIIE